MNFFTQLSALGQGLDVNLRVKGKNGKLTVSVEPLHQNVSRLKPLVLTGTPEEMDEGFIAQFDGIVTVAKGLITNLDEVRKDAADLEKKDPPKAPVKPAIEKGKKPERPKGAKPKAPEKKAAAPGKPEPVDMFDQAASEQGESENSDNSDESTDEQVDAGLSEEPNVSDE